MSPCLYRQQAICTAPGAVSLPGPSQMFYSTAPSGIWTHANAVQNTCRSDRGCRLRRCITMISHAGIGKEASYQATMPMLHITLSFISWPLSEVTVQTRHRLNTPHIFSALRTPAQNTTKCLPAATFDSLQWYFCHSVYRHNFIHCSRVRFPARVKILLSSQQPGWLWGQWVSGYSSWRHKLLVRKTEHYLYKVPWTRMGAFYLHTAYVFNIAFPSLNTAGVMRFLFIGVNSTWLLVFMWKDAVTSTRRQKCLHRTDFPNVYLPRACSIKDKK
jgi:hypothetical protein